jgi:hypothetical protein
MPSRNAFLATMAVMTLAASPVLAQGQSGSGGDSNINNFVRESPQGMAPQSNGIPTIVGNRDGQPVIRYEGAQPGEGGVQDGRVPSIVGNQDGQPVIRYGNSPTAAEGGTGRPAAGRPPAAAAPRAPMDPSVSAKIGPMLTSARAALRRGSFGAAAVSLEQAETSLLNARSDGTNGHAEALTSISAARAAANRRDRNGALQALDSVAAAPRG